MHGSLARICDDPSSFSDGSFNAVDNGCDDGDDDACPGSTAAAALSFGRTWTLYIVERPRLSTPTVKETREPRGTMTGSFRCSCTPLASSYDSTMFLE